MARTGALQYLLDLGAVGKPHGSAGGIDHQLSGQIAGDLLLVFEEQLFEFADK